MYSPKIDESLIPVIYRIGKEQRKAMTKLVNEFVKEGLKKYGKEVDEHERKS